MTGASEGREQWNAAGWEEQQVQRLLFLHHRWGDNTVQILSPDENRYPEAKGTARKELITAQVKQSKNTGRTEGNQDDAAVWLLSSFTTSWTVACQSPLSIRFPRQEYWSGLPFIFLGSKITADGDCNHEIKRCLLLGRKADQPR